MPSIPRPDHSDRKFTLNCTHTIRANIDDVFDAWTTGFDRWFAQAGTLIMDPHPGQPYFFYNRDEWGRHPHYGRILDMKKNEMVEMSWMTGNGTEVGTQGAETVLKVELTATDTGTDVRLTHSGFINQKSCDDHAENWPLALDILGEAIGG